MRRDLATDDQLLGCAVHEAGHAVANWLHGWDPADVVVRPNATGFVHAARATRRLRPGDSRPAFAAKAARSALSGVWAQARFVGIEPGRPSDEALMVDLMIEGSLGDFLRARELAELVIDDDAGDPEVWVTDWVANRTREVELVFWEPLWWHATEVLALELLERRRMHRRRIVPMLAELLPARNRAEMLARVTAGEHRQRWISA